MSETSFAHTVYDDLQDRLWFGGELTKTERKALFGIVSHVYHGRTMRSETNKAGAFELCVDNLARALSLPPYDGTLAAELGVRAYRELMPV